MNNALTLGIDASNLRSGGGLTHILEILNAISPDHFGFSKVIVWGGEETVSRLPKMHWLQLESPDALNQNLAQRRFWQYRHLSLSARRAGCDILFVPGGNFAGGFRPFVTMSRNMLPFEWQELRRFAFTKTGLRLLFLRFLQTRTFKNADGVIFLTEYAQKYVTGVTGSLPGLVGVIPHGINERFTTAPRLQKAIEYYNNELPLRIIYVSIVNRYKHQWHVVEAVSRLRERGLPLCLDLVGPSEGASLKRLEGVISRHDPCRSWVHVHGEVPYEVLHKKYLEADIGIFASSCENMPNILVEKMSAGLPIACSNRGPMPEILGDAGVYFDPESVGAIASTLKSLIESHSLRQSLAISAFKSAGRFTWQRCASETFKFLRDVASTSKT